MIGHTNKQTEITTLFTGLTTKDEIVKTTLNS